ncbi:hypothetical protein L484_027474 [Morus notabilis]|uniref:Uncharacterized protein n=1 Tax=Morus notabilis TaxID=981085 RepID=W9S8R7_9ROSA|nr:hypothetical protein L484_027474 [Morus notabilis]
MDLNTPFPCTAVHSEASTTAAPLIRLSPCTANLRGRLHRWSRRPDLRGRREVRVGGEVRVLLRRGVRRRLLKEISGNRAPTIC